MVVDGKGGLYETCIESDNIQSCRLNIVSVYKDFGHQNYYIHIGIAPTKSHDRVEWFVEKAVEIGAEEISFILTDHSERKNIKLNRINKRAISAMKQSLKAFLPKINDIVPLRDFMTKCNNDKKYIGYLNKGKNNHLILSATAKSDYCMLIGPEGDFSPFEINESQKFGFKPVSLGNNRLRTETAGLAACHILNLVNEK
ncbi:uncharacterized protein METZ01_LOCUS190181 [marine metagenome]|uniref:16S rRNA (uracil(1498)-N(3))-methyltransferase n=1 Tax=marine metagenome TaxID=408172 RepID=A0A382DI75_9ZZZZ